MTIPLHDYPDWQRSLSTADTAEIHTDAVVTPGNFTDTSILDMRPYQSFVLKVTPSLNETATDYGNVLIEMNWYLDEAQSVVVYQDTYSVYPSNVGGGSFVVEELDFYLQDVVHGPFCEAAVSNWGPDDISVDYALLGHTRPIPGPYARQTSDTSPASMGATSSRLLSDSGTLGAGASAVYPLRIAPGLVRVYVETATRNHYIRYITPTGATIDEYQVAAGVVDVRDIYFPTESMRIDVENTGAGNGDHFIRAVHDRRYW